MKLYIIWCASVVMLMTFYYTSRSDGLETNENDKEELTKKNLPSNFRDVVNLIRVEKTATFSSKSTIYKETVYNSLPEMDESDPDLSLPEIHEFDPVLNLAHICTVDNPADNPKKTNMFTNECYDLLNITLEFLNSFSEYCKSLKTSSNLKAEKLECIVGYMYDCKNVCTPVDSILIRNHEHFGNYMRKLFQDHMDGKQGENDEENHSENHDEIDDKNQNADHDGNQNGYRYHGYEDENKFEYFDDSREES